MTRPGKFKYLRCKDWQSCPGTAKINLKTLEQVLTRDHTCDEPGSLDIDLKSSDKLGFSRNETSAELGVDEVEKDISVKVIPVIPNHPNYDFKFLWSYPEKATVGFIKRKYSLSFKSQIDRSEINLNLKEIQLDNGFIVDDSKTISQLKEFSDTLLFHYKDTFKRDGELVKLQRYHYNKAAALKFLKNEGSMSYEEAMEKETESTQLNKLKQLVDQLSAKKIDVALDPIYSSEFHLLHWPEAPSSDKQAQVGEWITGMVGKVEKQDISTQTESGCSSTFKDIGISAQGLPFSLGSQTSRATLPYPSDKFGSQMENSKLLSTLDKAPLTPPTSKTGVLAVSDEELKEIRGLVEGLEEVSDEVLPGSEAHPISSVGDVAAIKPQAMVGKPERYWPQTRTIMARDNLTYGPEIKKLAKERMEPQQIQQAINERSAFHADEAIVRDWASTVINSDTSSASLPSVEHYKYSPDVARRKLEERGSNYDISREKVAKFHRKYHRVDKEELDSFIQNDYFMGMNVKVPKKDKKQKNYSRKIQPKTRYSKFRYILNLYRLLEEKKLEMGGIKRQ